MDQGCETRQERRSGEVTAANLSQRAQQIVTGLNDKRKEDTDMLAELKSALFTQVTSKSDSGTLLEMVFSMVNSASADNVYCAVEQHMYHKYEQHGIVFNQRVQELYACLERVAKLETELAQFKQDLTSFCHEID